MKESRSILEKLERMLSHERRYDILIFEAGKPRLLARKTVTYIMLIRVLAVLKS